MCISFFFLFGTIVFCYFCFEVCDFGVDEEKLSNCVYIGRPSQEKIWRSDFLQEEYTHAQWLMCLVCDVEHSSPLLGKSGRV